MSAGTHDISIEAGADFTEDLTWTDESAVLVNLTGASASLMVRYSIDDTSAVVTLTEASGSHGQLTLGGTAGTIGVLINATTTATLDPGPAVYDLLVTLSGGTKTRLMEGTCNVKQAVTR